MARIRSIKPEFWHDQELARLSRDARLLYIGLWNFCDDEGRMIGHPMYVKGHVFPYDVDVDVGPLLKELERFSKVQFYTDSSGGIFLCVRNFMKHQKIDKRFPSRLPAPPKFTPIPPDKSELPPETTPPDLGSRIKDLGSGSGSEECLEPQSVSKPPALMSTPLPLVDLGLYARDTKLCQRWVSLYPEWVKAYPGVDVLAEIRKAHAWEVSNPTRVKKNRPKFLASWLARAQDQAGRGNGNGKKRTWVDALNEMGGHDGAAVNRGRDTLGSKTSGDVPSDA